MIYGRLNQMMDKKPEMKWGIIYGSVKGASHERSGQPNQDAFAYFLASNESLPLILAASDGHGGAKYFRSDEGASFAVVAAIDILAQFQESLTSFSNSSWLEEQLTKSLVNTWRGKVNSHLNDKPLTDGELNLLEEKEGSTAPQMVKDNPMLAYGATILAVMITASFIVYLQLGDGDILTISEQGEISNVFPVNSKHFANETTSLCSSNAWCDFQFRIEKISPSSVLPALILLSTDGYKDSFSSDEEFHKVGSDLFEMIDANQLEEIKRNLSSWLSEATQMGSGDDITLGILYRMDAFKILNAQSIEQEHEDHTKGKSLGLDTQSGDCYGSLQCHQPEL